MNATINQTGLNNQTSGNIETTYQQVSGFFRGINSTLNPIVTSINSFITRLLPENIMWVKYVIGGLFAYKVSSIIIEFLAGIFPFIWEQDKLWKIIVGAALYYWLYTLGWR